MAGLFNMLWSQPTVDSGAVAMAKNKAIARSALDAILAAHREQKTATEMLNRQLVEYAATQMEAIVNSTIVASTSASPPPVATEKDVKTGPVLTGVAVATSSVPAATSNTTTATPVTSVTVAAVATPVAVAAAALPAAKTEWKVGDYCEALYNKTWYDAVIAAVTPDGVSCRFVCDNYISGVGTAVRATPAVLGAARTAWTTATQKQWNLKDLTLWLLQFVGTQTTAGKHVWLPAEKNQCMIYRRNRIQSSLCNEGGMGGYHVVVEPPIRPASSGPSPMPVDAKDGFFNKEDVTTINWVHDKMVKAISDLKSLSMPSMSEFFGDETIDDQEAVQAMYETFFKSPKMIFA